MSSKISNSSGKPTPMHTLEPAKLDFSRGLLTNMQLLEPGTYEQTHKQTTTKKQNHSSHQVVNDPHDITTRYTTTFSALARFARRAKTDKTPGYSDLLPFQDTRSVTSADIIK